MNDEVPGGELFFILSWHSITNLLQRVQNGKRQHEKFKYNMYQKWSYNDTYKAKKSLPRRIMRKTQSHHTYQQADTHDTCKYVDNWNQYRQYHDFEFTEIIEPDSGAATFQFAAEFLF